MISPLRKAASVEPPVDICIHSGLFALLEVTPNERRGPHSQAPGYHEFARGGMQRPHGRQCRNTDSALKHCHPSPGLNGMTCTEGGDGEVISDGRTLRVDQ